VESLEQYQMVAMHALKLKRFSAPCYEHKSPPAFLCSNSTMFYVPTLALFAANLQDLFPSRPGLDAVLHASEELRKLKCEVLPLFGSNST
jgi:hypothetical protein